MHWSILPSKIAGKVKIPPSKSHTMRAYLFALMANGISKIEHPLISSDTEAMLRACSQFGAHIEKHGSSVHIEGKGGRLDAPNNVIDAENSGQILRFLGAMATYAPGYIILTGDESVREQRVVEPLLDGLMQLGAFAVSTRRNGKAPIIVSGPFLPGKARINGRDSQPVSALLMAAAFSEGPVEIIVEGPEETPWIDLTLSWLDRVGARYQREKYTYFRVEGDTYVDAFSYKVPGDFSSAAFPIAAALTTNSSVEVENLDFKDVQGDKVFLDLVEEMGAKVERRDNGVLVEADGLKGIDIDLNNCIDALPLLAVLGCFAKGKTRLYNGKGARNKESDRIASIVRELEKMGAKVEEKEDGLIVQKSKLKGNILNAVKDHRMAMALSVAAMGAEGGSHIEDVECVKKSYPNFVNDLKKLGAKFE